MAPIEKWGAVLSSIGTASAKCAEAPRILLIPSSIHWWAVWAKIRKNGRLGGRRGETRSRNMAATQKNLKSVDDFL